MSSGTGDVHIEEVTEEEVGRDFSGRYTTRAESDESEEDTSRLLSQRYHTFKHFTFQHLRYVWCERDQSYERLHGLEVDTPVSSLLSDLAHGLPGARVGVLQQLHGPNLISVEVPSYLSLLIEEVLNPFYFFQVDNLDIVSIVCHHLIPCQVCSITLWLCDDYYYYAACIVIISLISILLELRETRQQAEKVHDMVRGGEGMTEVLRPGEGKVRRTSYKIVQTNCKMSTFNINCCCPGGGREQRAGAGGRDSGPRLRVPHVL